ncbi:MAG: undecaprenyl/decaprenyl-phosphate alpha-N-acetylglucosaminyl 1-phosphate transferase [Bacteroidaceae bacterium]|nr:undecaprenyl/decaprenyl-phosphate alpha-N-acetylglucosaminyl 1-phosphate transferase [Bacteroidaceae bacterium]
MKEIHHILIPALFAFLGTLWIHPKVLKIAIMKNLVDNPDARKLQRNPVPVMGGIAVFFGILIGLCTSQTIFENANVFMLVSAMMIMLYTGTIDDIIDLTPTIRFVIEILIVLWLIVINDSSINSFWGLWGVGVIPDLVAWPLTVFAAVGIINAVNLIDGVNGLSSGFCFMASTLFAIMFYYSGNTVMCTLAVSASGAIVPFFLHNVFGKSTKMFIGDGGTLVIGTMMSMFVISILDENSLSASYALKGMGLIPFTLAILAVPIFDTLRVMSTRMLHGSSPFHPDKTHLHHMFIDLGFSHVGTTVSILSLNFLIVASWFLSYKLGASVEVQLYIVLALSIMVTFVFYNFAKRQIAKQGKALVFFEKIAKSMQFEKKGIWEFAQKTIDKL